MFGVHDLGLGHLDESSRSPTGANPSSYHLSSSVPFGFSIQDAIRELSLEEDGDVKTFLTKSANLLASAPPPVPISFADPYHAQSSGRNPTLTPLQLFSVEVSDEETIGSKAYWESFIQPPRQAPVETPMCAWEYVLPSEIESTFGLRSTPSHRRSHQSGKQDTTPVTSLKYNIQTPPRSGTATRLMSSSRELRDSADSASAASAHVPTSSSLPTMSTVLSRVVSMESADDIATEAASDSCESASKRKERNGRSGPSNELLEIAPVPSRSSLATSETTSSELSWPGNLEELLRWPQLEDFFVTIPEWAVCSVCSELYDCPVSWPNCDHTFCKTCVTRILNYGHRECPLCRGLLPNDFGFGELVVSNRMASAILLLPVRCRWGITSKRGPHATPSTLRSSPSSSSMASLSQLSFDQVSSSVGSVGSERASSISSLEQYMRELPDPKWAPRADEEGCLDIVPLSSLPNHLLTCEHAPVRCTFRGCRKIVKRRDIDAHQSDCPYKTAQCEYCLRNFTRATLAAHQQECPEISITCDCGETMLRKAMSIHCATMCPYALLACPYSGHGCLYSGPRRELDTHLANCPYEALKGFIAQTENRFQEYDRTIERLESMILSLRAQVHNQSRNTPRQVPQTLHSSSTRASQVSSSSAFPGPASSGGQVGHGARRGRFWDDYGQDGSDDEFSIYL